MHHTGVVSPALWIDYAHDELRRPRYNGMLLHGMSGQRSLCPFSSRSCASKLKGDGAIKLR
jgi:hypothetical protein